MQYVLFCVVCCVVLCRVLCVCVVCCVLCVVCLVFGVVCCMLCLVLIDVLCSAGVLGFFPLYTKRIVLLLAFLTILFLLLSSSWQWSDTSSGR